MKTLFVAALASFVFSRVADAAPTGLPAALETKIQTAFADISKAKTALDSGKSKTSEGWLSKAEGLLKSALDAAPAQQGPSSLSKAESEAAKLDPSLASRLGVSTPGAEPTPDAGTSDGAAAKAPSPTSGLSGLVDVYRKVSAARELLKTGNNSQAKSLLDQIPASPADMLKSVGRL